MNGALFAWLLFGLAFVVSLVALGRDLEIVPVDAGRGREAWA